MKAQEPFSPEQRDLLARVVGAIIPESEKYGVPGADDADIFATILQKSVRHAAVIRGGLDQLTDLLARNGVVLPASSRAELAPWIDEFEKSGGGAFVGIVTLITAQAYYQDPRVLRSLDVEARPPFPKGQELPQGDWSLLDPVKARGKHYREV